ncbi:hypothetical protein Ancab_020973 [Ancistrocladus abbreviatus]
MKEIMVVLHLIMNSPNLQELHISGSSNTLVALEAPDLDFWESQCPSDCTFKCLKTVKLTDMCGVPHEMELIRFLLRNSPALKGSKYNETCKLPLVLRCKRNFLMCGHAGKQEDLAYSSLAFTVTTLHVMDTLPFC